MTATLVDAAIYWEVGKWNPGKLTDTRWSCKFPQSTVGVMGGDLGVSLDTLQYYAFYF